jgi:hypothetical protein
MRWPIRLCSGLRRVEAMSCACIPEGLLALKKLGLANFWSPAKQKVIPKKALRGRRAHPDMAMAFGGGENQDL